MAKFKGLRTNQKKKKKKPNPKKENTCVLCWLLEKKKWHGLLCRIYKSVKIDNELNASLYGDGLKLLQRTFSRQVINFGGFKK